MSRQKSWSEREFGNQKKDKWKPWTWGGRKQDVKRDVLRIITQAEVVMDALDKDDVNIDIDYDELLRLTTDLYSKLELDKLAQDHARRNTRVGQLVRENANAKH